ncbi:MAG: SusC/RagA family TonB-linked outer membrane protein [Bacteroidales bacterium]
MRRILISFCLCLLSVIVFAQKREYNITTLDGTLGGPLPGVSVIVKGTTDGGVTNLDGQLKMSFDEGATLIFSFIGYKNQEVVAGSNKSISVTMSEDVQNVDEVLVIGYATGTSRTISGAVDKISRKDMNQGVVNNPLTAIQGRVPGVVIQKPGGDPSSTPSIRVRGTTSLSGGNDPLVVIDGVFGDLGLLNALSPNDIESFTILKDASETAQYGSRGASGVIVVTTVKGKAGQMNLSYQGNFSAETPYKNIKMLNGDQYRSVITEKGYVNALDGGYNTNWFKEIERTGFSQNHTVNFGAGSDVSSYRASIGIINQEGIVKTSDMQNYTAKLDATQKMFDNKLKIDFGIFGSIKYNNYINNHHKTFYSAATMNPTFPTGQLDNGRWPEDPSANEIDNPLGRLSIEDKEENAYINVHGKISYDIIKDLTISAFGSYTSNNKTNGVFVPINTKEGIREDGGKAYNGLSKSASLMGNVTLSYKKVIEKHSLNAMLVAEGQDYKYSGFNATSRGFGTDYFGPDNMSAGAIVKWGDVGSYSNGYQLASFLARLNYMLLDKYIITVNMRTDGSSKLGDNNKWGFFPSASAAWVINNEGFMQDIKESVSTLKLRAGYGVTGNQDAIAPYNSKMLLIPDKLTTVNGKPVVTYRYARNQNPDLKWETKHMFDVGLDFGFMEDRLSGSVDYYTSLTKGLLYNYAVPVPPFVYPNLLANLGEMENNGIELNLNYKVIQSQDFDLAVGTNLAYQKNKLKSLSGSYMGQDLSAPEYMRIASMNGAGFIGGNNGTTYQMVGQPLGVFYLPKCNGLADNGLGSFKYNVVDLNGNGIDLNDGEDRYIAGQAMPKVYLGANINIRYKNFDFQTQLNGAFGHKIYNGTSLSYMNMNSFPTYNVMESAPEKNIKDNTVTDYWLEKGDYLNIDYISLGYNIDATKFNKVIRNIRITAAVNNLYTFTNYSGLTPMINSSIVNGSLGLDDKQLYPVTRTFSLGLSVNF